MPSTSSPTQTATRSLWIGNIDSTVTIENLTQLFSSFGPIESVRLLLEKECAFVNFFHVEDAVRAKEEVLGRLGVVSAIVLYVLAMAELMLLFLILQLFNLHVLYVSMTILML